MNIIINSRFLTQPITGVQRYSHEITKELLRLDKDKFILVAPKEVRAEYSEIFVTINTPISISGHPWEQIVLPRCFNKLKGEILFSPGNTGPLNIYNQVVTIHDAAVFTRPEGFNSNFVKWYRFLLPRLAKKARRLVTVSEFSKVELVESLNIPPEKVVPIYNGVGEIFKPHSQDRQDFIAKNGLPERYVLALGSRAKNKNFLGLLKAWELLVREDKMQDISLVIAGGTASTLQADEISVLLSKLPNVHDAGYVTDETLPLLYSSAEAFVFPSFYEGFGLPPLEAMACGTPVVVANTASLPEVVGDAGVYVNPYDVEDIARGIYKVLIDMQLQSNLSSKGLERAKQFTWKKTAKETFQVFEEVASDVRSY